ncbi:MAG: zf-HC2 domain-containing protein [Chloroflexota bacterium]
MNCLIVQKLLQLYLDRALDPMEQGSVQRHVASCGMCRAAFVRLERTVMAVESLPRLPAPGTLYLRTMALVRAEHRSKQASSPRYVALSGLTAAAAFAGLALILIPLMDLVFNLGDFVLESPATMLEALLAMSVSVEASLVAGSALLLTAGSAAVLELVKREQATQPV